MFCVMWDFPNWFFRSRVEFNFAHVSQSLTFFDKSCQDLWVEVKVETHSVGTHRVFLISDMFTFSRSWRTWSSSCHFWKIIICQLSTLSVNCEQKKSYDRLKNASIRILKVCVPLFYVKWSIFYRIQLVISPQCMIFFYERSILCGKIFFWSRKIFDPKKNLPRKSELNFSRTESQKNHRRKKISDFHRKKNPIENHENPTKIDHLGIQ